MFNQYYIPVGVVLLYFSYKSVKSSILKIKVKPHVLYVTQLVLSGYMLLLGLTIFLSGLGENIALALHPLLNVLSLPYEFITNILGKAS